LRKGVPRSGIAYRIDNQITIFDESLPDNDSLSLFDPDTRKRLENPTIFIEFVPASVSDEPVRFLAIDRSRPYIQPCSTHGQPDGSGGQMLFDGRSPRHPGRNHPSERF
jgi:hypothetical protein